MSSKIMCGVLAATAACASMAAGFVDERSSAQPVAKSSTVAQQGRLTGDFSLNEWSQLAPPGPDGGVALSLAIIRLLPSNFPPVEIEGDSSVVERPVSWANGGTRQQALAQIASRNGLNIHLESRRISVKPVAQPAVVAPVAAAPAAAVAAVQPPAGPVKTTFDVKLSDIKLSTSMARWAANGGVRILWDADKHVLIGAPETFMATSVFDAVTQAFLTPGIRNSGYPLEVCEYPNTPPLLRITRQGEQAKDCPSTSK